MKLKNRPLEASFVKQLNRFSVLVRVQGNAVPAHLPNSGRLGELLVSGRRCYVLPAQTPNRKTHYDLVLIETPDGILTYTDARMPNHLFEEAFRLRFLHEFKAYTRLEREVAFQDSRLDFRLTHVQQIYYVEVKSVTLVNNGISMFPDAPTERGTRHLHHLIELKQSGFGAAVVFWVQRADANEVRPHWQSDPAFTETFLLCQQNGVKVLACKSNVTVGGFEFAGSLPVVVKTGF